MEKRLFNGKYRKALTLSYDDGVVQDRRLLEILAKYGLKCTFNLNSGSYSAEGILKSSGLVHRRMSLSDAQSAYKNTGHEIAVHGVKHLNWTELSPIQLKLEIDEDKRALTEQYGTAIRGAAYPYGAFDDKTAEYLESCGIEYCRTVISSGNFEIPSEPLKLRPTCHHNDPKLFDLLEQFLSDDGDEPLLFYLWGHSYEFDERNNWDLIEEFAKRASGCKDVLYATNIEALSGIRHK